MARGAMVTNPTLARLIAESKQITADLMVLRREAAAIATARGDQKERISRANCRFSLIIDNAHAFVGEMHDLYMHARGWDRPEREVEHMTTAALTNGRLSLCNGQQKDEER